MQNSTNLLKKILTIAITSYFLTSNAFARPTDGNYLEVDVISVKSYQDAGVAGNVFSENQLRMEDNDVNSSGSGVGVSYKYAFSMDSKLPKPYDRLFFAPGMFYDNLNTETRDNFSNEFKLNKRYGAKLDVGMDFNHNISAYFTNGVSVTDYTVDWVNLQNLTVLTDSITYSTVTDSTPRTRISDTNISYFYGFGLTYSPLKSLYFVLEYSQQKNELEAKADNYQETGIIFDRVYNTNRFVKFGIAYKF